MDREINVLHINERKFERESATEEVCVAAIEGRLYRVVNIGKSKFERESDRGTSVSQKGEYMGRYCVSWSCLSLWRKLRKY